MKKAKRVLALVLAFVMISSIFMTESFAKLANENYNAYKTDLSSNSGHINGVDKIEFTAGEGAAYILDLLDTLLHDKDLKVEYSTKILWKEVKAKLYFAGIDELLYTLYNLTTVCDKSNTDNVRNLVEVTGLLDAGDLIGIFGFNDFGRLTHTGLKNPNSGTTAEIRAVPATNVPTGLNIAGSSDLDVLQQIVDFLAANKGVLSDLVNTPTGDPLNLKITVAGFSVINVADLLGSGIMAKLFTDFTGFLKDLLYTKLWDSSADGAPANWSYDTALQQLINWVLIEGTGTTAADGGKSILGENFEGFLPDIAEYPHGASIGADSNFYQLVNNALKALLSGFVGEKLEGLLFDLLGLDPEKDPLGPQSVLNDTLPSMLLGTGTEAGIIENLCHENGAPSINWAEDTDAQQFPIPRIRKVLDWFFNGGGLATFLLIDDTGIHLTDNFVQLLRDVLRKVPDLVKNLELMEYPEGLIHSAKELTEKDIDEIKGDIYTTFQGEQIYFDAEDECYKYRYDYSNGISADDVVNDSDNSGSNYRNPLFFRPAYVIPIDVVWGDILKVVLDHFIEGCYFPEWADTIPEVGAYALATLAQQYLPENNYFDRLDKYHWVYELGNSEGSYTNKGTQLEVDPLAYTETITVKDENNQNKTVIFPRAAADIGASLGAFFLNGAFDFEGALGYWPETDTTFEAYLTEFLLWGVIKYMPLFCGKYNNQTKQFGNFDSGASGTWQSTINSALASFNQLRTSTNIKPRNGVMTNRIPTASLQNIIYNLIDNTLFKLFDITWLPDWLAVGGSKALFCDWLGDSLVDIDLQKIFNLFQVNTNPNAEFRKSVTIVLLRLIDRVLGTLVGGNALLPTTTTGSNNRNVFTTATTLETFDSFLASNSTLKSFIESLLHYLSKYLQPLAQTLFPILAQYMIGTIKDTSYPTEYIGSQAVSTQELKDYIAYYNGEINSYPFVSDYLSFFKEKTAEDVIKDLRIANEDIKSATVDGVPVTQIKIPAEYTSPLMAEKAAGYIADNLGQSTHVSNKRENGHRVYYIMIDVDFKSATADMQKVPVMESGKEVDREYVYSNFRRAQPTARTVANKGKVSYETTIDNKPVYYLIEREDFTTGNIKYLNRRNNAVEDAEEFLEKREEFITEGLSNAYASWLMFIINCKLREAGHYDKNDDGIITTDRNSAIYDSYPNQPSKNTPYPFVGTGSTVDTEIDYRTFATKTYSFAAANSSAIIADALDYADDTDPEDPEKRENDVKLGQTDTESVVRLALNTHKFDIDDRHSGDDIIGWSDLIASDIQKINNTCAVYGLTFHWDTEHPDKSYITRPAFALLSFTDNIGVGWIYETDDDGKVTKNEEEKLSLKPASKYDKDGRSSVNNLQASFVEFAKNIKEYDEGIAKHFDDISWRASLTDDGMRTTNVIDPLTWVLNYTYRGIYPNNNEARRNLIYNPDTGKNEPKYSKSSFETFQKAYDYGKSLKDALTAPDSDLKVAQSAISKICKEIMTSYANLELFGGAADWSPLDLQIAYAQANLNSNIGLNMTTLEQKDPENGYTLESLLALRTALIKALEFKAENVNDLDSDGAPLIQTEADKLEAAIRMLQFVPGVEVGVVADPEYILDSDNTVRPITNPLKSNLITVGLIYGFDEGVGFTESIKNEAISPSGFVVNNGSGSFDLHPSPRGNGTGSKVIGRKSANNVVAQYYAVVVGDINGDARIDGNDKTAVEFYIRTNKSFANVPAQAVDNEGNPLWQTDPITGEPLLDGNGEQIPLMTTIPAEDYYLAFASDTNGDGNIDLEDIAKIKAHYQYRDVDPNEVDIDGFTYNGSPVDGTINQTALANANLANPPAVRND